jgi:hypothetical protein
LSNADSKTEVLFKVGTRQLSPDLSAAAPELNARDLGQISAPALLEIARKLTEIPAAQLNDADPHVVITGRRGRFLVRPHRGKLRLSDAGDAGRTPLEISPEDLANYLDGSELPTATAASAESPRDVIEMPSPRLGLVAGLVLFSAILLGGSAYFTFREVPFDHDVDYSAVPAAELPAVRQQIVGEFSTGKGEMARTLTIRPDGTVTLIEFGPGHTVADRREDVYQLVRRETTPVARAARLGPIEFQLGKTLRYAGETYTREP